MGRRPPVRTDSTGDLLFEFCVVGVALSAQSNNRVRLRAWKAKVASAARAAAVGATAVVEPIEVRLSEFSEVRRKDRDNFAKPILDAMQEVLFVNDRQVQRLEIDWYDIEGSYRVRFMSPLVASALSAGYEFVWVRIHRCGSRETLIS